MRGFGDFLKDVAAPAMIAIWVVWLAYGAVTGAAGYRALGQLRTDAEAQGAELAAIRERRLALEKRADLLNPKSLDPDMVDERVRAVLGYAHAGDLVIPADEIKRMLSAKKPHGEQPVDDSAAAAPLVSDKAGA